MKGFTLIEVLISALVLVVVIASFTYLFRSGISLLTSAEDFNRAANSLELKAEEIRAASFDNIQNQTFDKGRVEAALINPELKEIKLTLNWRAGREPLRLYTLRAK